MPGEPARPAEGPRGTAAGSPDTLGTGGGTATRQAPQPEMLHGGGSDEQTSTDLHLLPPADPGGGGGGAPGLQGSASRGQGRAQL